MNEHISKTVEHIHRNLEMLGFEVLTEHIPYHEVESRFAPEGKGVVHEHWDIQARRVSRTPVSSLIATSLALYAVHTAHITSLDQDTVLVQVYPDTSKTPNTQPRSIAWMTFANVLRTQDDFGAFTDEGYVSAL